MPAPPKPANLRTIGRRTYDDTKLKRKHGVDRLEAQLRANGPAPWVTPDSFCVLAVPAAIAPRIAVQSLAAFTAPALETSKLPEDFVTWTSTYRAWHLIFHFSVPRPAIWMYELHGEVLQDLERYVILWYERGASGAVFDYAEGALATATSKTVATFAKHTGLSLRDLRTAQGCGEPWWTSMIAR
jgi:hypothetical protein